ncbi:MAG: D-glycerate dehydrogenase [Myxococcota bacterium]|nr:D-glycerate dehydrogenase [Myxococcota bacterium]
MRPKVLITQPIDAAAEERLRSSGLAVDVWTEPEPMGPTRLIERVRGCQGLISMLTDRVDSAVMDAGPLKAIAQHAVGVNNIDLAAARARGIPVAHTPGVLTDATADLAMALLLGAARRIPEGDALVRSGRWKGWSPTLLRGMELRGATLGIVGLGRIGTAVAERARAFGMTVIHSNRSSGVPLGELLTRSDAVSLHCPLTDATRHLIDAAALARMKSTAVLINTARGAVVDEAALVRALESGEIAGAGLDVFEDEPAVHPGLVASPKALLLPHLGSATLDTRRRMGMMVADDLIRGLAAKPLNHGVLL